jgi:heme exporter protein D
MSNWLAMGGYGGFVWGSYLVAAAAIAAEVWMVSARKRRALQRAAAESEAQSGAA